MVSTLLKRREFIKYVSSMGANATVALWMNQSPLARFFLSSQGETRCLSCHQQSDKIDVTQTQFKHDAAYVQCNLCVHHCIIAPGQRGQCNARWNDNGQLKSLVYGRPVSLHVDPIEKKPLYHFYPGSSAFSLGTTGCPLSCKFCQNWQISQASPEDYVTKDIISPNQIVSLAEQRTAQSIAFTYNEPTVFFEYAIDIAKEAKKKHIPTVMISCGFMDPEPLKEMCEWFSAIKIDLKGFDQAFYQEICGASLEPVLKNIHYIHQTSVHLELVNLLVPTLNDSKNMITNMVKWVVAELGQDVPIHFTRFHPAYKMPNLAPTPKASLDMAYDIAKQHCIHYPYIGNFPGHAGNHTYCPSCGKMIILRTGFFITDMHILNGRCQYCQYPISGIWLHQSPTIKETSIP